MATTSFTKNFEVSPQDSKRFVRIMTEPVKPLLPRGFKSLFVNLKKSPKLQHELKQAAKHD